MLVTAFLDPIQSDAQQGSLSQSAPPQFLSRPISGGDSSEVSVVVSSGNPIGGQSGGLGSQGKSPLNLRVSNCLNDINQDSTRYNHSH